MPTLLEADGGKVKPAGYQQTFEPWHINEIVKCKKDSIYFIKKYVMIQNPILGAMKFSLYDYQNSLIETYQDNKLVIALLSRQCGKTQTAAAFLLWWAIFKRDQRILIASKDKDGATDIMSRLWYSYEELPWWIKPGTKTNIVTRKEFDNGSTIFASATTKTSGRGKSNSLIYLDEFAFVPPGIANDFWTSIYPTIATGGKCIITSTPNTDEDKFAQIWFNATMSPTSDVWRDVFAERSKTPGTIDGIEEEADTWDIEFENEESKMLYGSEEDNAEIEDDEMLVGFVGFHAHWTRIPDINSKSGFRGPQFKKQTIRAGLTEEEWLREYECAFVSGDSTLIASTKLATLRQVIRKPRFIDRWGMRWYKEIVPNQIYGVVLDPSEGVGADDACIQVWEVPQLRQVAEWHSNLPDQVEQTKMLRRTLKRIFMIQMNDPEHEGGCQTYYSVERNGLGIGILTAIEYEDEATFPGFLIDSSMTSINVRGSGMSQAQPNKWRGLLTSVSSKKRYAIEFKNLVERNLLIPKSKHLASQLKTFIRSGNSYAAKEGAKDDIVMSCVLMCHLIDELRYHEPDLDDIIRPDMDDYDENDFDHPDNMPMAPIV
jgi:hypothetical protein